ncbi:MAG: hypothetical protein AB7Q17_18470 [Phycisphaerae bacterium]
MGDRQFQHDDATPQFDTPHAARPSAASLDALMGILAAADADSGAHPPVDLSRLRAVAERRSGEPFGLEPVGVELVQAALRTGLGESPAAGAPALAAAVAKTLFDDARARARLEQLWHALCAQVERRPEGQD